MTAAERDPLLEAVDLIVPAFVESGLDEVEIDAGELTVRVARPRSVVALDTLAVSGTPSDPAAAATAPVPGSGVGGPSGDAARRGEEVTPFGAPAPGMQFVTAPLTGVWYGSPSPGARPYVEVGSEVAAGQVIGLIEAMKLFNEIKSDVSGRVNRILVENGKLVKRQQPILEVDPR